MKSVQETYSQDKGWYKEEVEPEVGQVVTVYLYSDQHVYDVVAISKSTKVLTLRVRTPILVKPPVMIPGGFAGVVVERAEWKTESNENGATVRVNWSDKDQCYKMYGRNRVVLNRDSYFYDYEF